MADEVVAPAKSLFEALAESAPDAILTIDTDSTILSANQAVRRIFGYEPEALVGESLQVLMPESLRERHARGFSRYLATGTKRIPWTGTRLTARTRDGREIPIEISFGEFVDESGRRILSGFIRDISEHLQQQRTLAAMREDLRLHSELLAAVEHAIVSTDPDGTVLTWNRHAEELYGWRAAQAVGRKLRDLLDPAREFAHDAIPGERLRSGERVSYERQVRCSNGDTRWVSVVAAPMLDPDGNVERIVGTSVDISARRQIEEQLRQAQKLDAVGRLAGGIAHDFNNLLTVILANSELAAAASKPGSDQAADIAEIMRAANRGAVLTRQLLTFSKRDPLPVRELDVNATILDLEKMLRRLIGENIEISTDLAADVPHIDHDLGSVEQAITNLVVNARDAMPAGGTLTIATRRAEIGAAKAAASKATPGTYACVGVRDTGHGMSERVRERIFEPFFSTKGPDKGTGLGLATVYGIVTQRGGFIEVESSIGAGSSFSLYFPAST